jgi:hypothetical protein
MPFRVGSGISGRGALNDEAGQLTAMPTGRARLLRLGASAWLVLGLAPLHAQESAAAAGAGDSVQELIDRQRGMLRIGRSACKQDAGEIVVCGRRDPDRYRVPPGDGPKGSDLVLAERRQLLEPSCANIGGRGCGPNLIPVITVTADGVKLGPARRER